MDTQTNNFLCSVNVLAATIVYNPLMCVEEMVGSGSISGTVAGIATHIDCSPTAITK